MKLEDVTVALRPREPWEAIDLGCSMVRRDFAQLMSLWAATVVPAWLVIAVLMHNHPAWFSFAVWWLKPLYDRVPLFFVSKAAFGVRPGFRETWKAWPRLWSRDLLGALLVRRFSMIRSFALPVTMLEGQKGRAVRSRVTALATDGGGSGATATWIFLKLEFVVWLGLIAFTSSFVPEAISPNWHDLMLFQDASDFVIQPAYYWWLNGCYLLAVTLVEPFYVGAGFGLYLNCRTRLEGWDVELVFRRLAARLRGVVSAATALVLITLCGPSVANAGAASPATASVGLAGISPAPGQAASETADIEEAGAGEAAATPGKKEANDTAKEILKRPEFRIHTRKTREWVADSPAGEVDFGPLKILGYVFFWLLVAAAVSALAVFLIRNRHLFGLPQLAPRSAPRNKAPRVVMGMNIGRDSLPDDIVAAARGLWNSRATREAMSLLYRGALSLLVERDRLPIRDSDTEDDCLDHVRRVGERSMTGYFSRLTNAWICEAYAGIATGNGEFDALCHEWPFQAAGPPARGLAATSAAFLLLVVPFIAGCNGQWKEVEKTLGYRGKARFDPFLAAGMLFKEQGHKVERTAVMGKLPDAENGIVFASGEAGMPEGRSRQLLHWVNGGGHLVYCVAGGMPYDDWSEGGDFDRHHDADRRPDPILSTLGVKLNDQRPGIDLKDNAKIFLKKRGSGGRDDPGSDEAHGAPRSFGGVVTKELQWGAQTYAIEVHDGISFAASRALRPGEWSTTDAKEVSILSLHYGAGRVTFLNHARPLRNRYLGDNDHGAWLLALAGEAGDSAKDVRFVVGTSASFWSLLWERAWMPLIGLVFVTAVWLWKSGRRFGPVMPVELTDTKHFIDHISALGQFFFRLRRGDVLVKSAASAVRSRFKKRFPQLAEAGDDVIIPVIARQSGFQEERVRAILSAHPPGQDHHLVRLLRDLQLLRQSL